MQNYPRIKIVSAKYFVTSEEIWQLKVKGKWFEFWWEILNKKYSRKGQVNRCYINIIRLLV